MTVTQTRPYNKVIDTVGQFAYLHTIVVTIELTVINLYTPDIIAFMVEHHYRGIPDLLGSGINIEHMYNRSRGAYAYMMCDTNTEPTPECIQNLNAIEGAIRVRVID